MTTPELPPNQYQQADFPVDALPVFLETMREFSELVGVQCVFASCHAVTAPEGWTVVNCDKPAAIG